MKLNQQVQVQISGRISIFTKHGPTPHFKTSFKFVNIYRVEKAKNQKKPNSILCFFKIIAIGHNEFVFF